MYCLISIVTRLSNVVSHIYCNMTRTISLVTTESDKGWKNYISIQCYNKGINCIRIYIFFIYSQQTQIGVGSHILHYWTFIILAFDRLIDILQYMCISLYFQILMITEFHNYILFNMTAYDCRRNFKWFSITRVSDLQRYPWKLWINDMFIFLKTYYFLFLSLMLTGGNCQK